MLSVKNEWTFPFANVLMIGLSNSSGNYWLETKSFLIAPTKRLLLKYLSTIEGSPRWYPSYLNVQQN